VLAGARRLAWLPTLLAVVGCGEGGALHSHSLRLDLSACLRLPDAAPGDSRSCGSRLDALGGELTLCAALHGSRGEVVLPLRMALPSGELAPASPAPALPLTGSEEELAIKVFYLRPGQACEAGSFGVDVGCSAANGCLMATAKASFPVKVTGGEQVAGWGPAGLDCAFECGDPAFCGASDGVVDEGLSRSCSDDVGECRQGQQTCAEGEWGECGGRAPAP